MAEPAVDEYPQQSARLVCTGMLVLLGAAQETAFPIALVEGQELWIGSGPDAHIRLRDPLVSRRHAVLRGAGVSLILRDAGSTNGTKVNGVPIGQHELRAGDVITVGGSAALRWLPAARGQHGDQATTVLRGQEWSEPLPPALPLAAPSRGGRSLVHPALPFALGALSVLVAAGLIWAGVTYLRNGGSLSREAKAFAGATGRAEAGAAPGRSTAPAPAIAANERTATATLAAIAAAQLDYLTVGPTGCFATSFAALAEIPSAARYLSAEVIRGERAGYTFQLAPGSDGCTEYLALAAPTRPGETGRTRYAVDQHEKVRLAQPFPDLEIFAEIPPEKRDVNASLARCQAGTPEACTDAGNLFTRGLGVAIDDMAALDLYEKACAGKHGKGCAHAGIAYLYGQGAEKNPDAARPLLSLACELGDLMSCVRHAELVEGYQTPTGDAPLAASSYEKACTVQFAGGCLGLGDLYASGRGGVPEDPARALRAYELACQGGFYQGCGIAAHLLEEGRGAVADVAAAQRLYGLACDGGDAPSCDRLGEAHRDGRFGLAPDDRAALTFFLRSCELIGPAGCKAAGDMLGAGRGAARDPGKAGELYGRACHWGDEGGCEAAAGEPR
ncbi:MAG: FHA domain-containing protein [Candidatus Schekmanbacteria bacterium]|nr:FHA domain-containing protein [Candidatus Schekmanbacteria bacterium]